MEQNKEYTLARLILRLANRIVKNRDRHVKELGLTTEQADSLLFFLDRKDAVINDLKDHLGVTHQTARGIVQRMESKGLVQTRKSKEDGRYQVVSPTQAGWRTGSILLRNGIQTGSCLLHGLTTEQEEQLCQMLQVAMKNLETAEYQLLPRNDPE